MAPWIFLCVWQLVTTCHNYLFMIYDPYWKGFPLKTKGILQLQFCGDDNFATGAFGFLGPAVAFCRWVNLSKGPQFPGHINSGSSISGRGIRLWQMGCRKNQGAFTTHTKHWVCWYLSSSYTKMTIIRSLKISKDTQFAQTVAVWIVTRLHTELSCFNSCDLAPWRTASLGFKTWYKKTRIATGWLQENKNKLFVGSLPCGTQFETTEGFESFRSRLAMADQVLTSRTKRLPQPSELMVRGSSMSTAQHHCWKARCRKHSVLGFVSFVACFRDDIGHLFVEFKGFQYLDLVGLLWCLAWRDILQTLIEFSPVLKPAFLDRFPNVPAPGSVVEHHVMRGKSTSGQAANQHFRIFVIAPWVWE